MILSTHGIIGSSVTVASGDADALAFFTAAGITDTTQKTAVNTLVTDLKTANIWTKMKALYPFVGGSATSHKFNLKDPRDLNDAFRLTFFGGLTHDSNGMLGNGINGYVNTNLIASSILNKDSLSLSFYSRTNDNYGTNTNEINLNAGYSASGYLSLRTNNKTTGVAASSLGNDDTDGVAGSNTSSGFALATKTAANSTRKYFKNGALIGSNSLNVSTNLQNNAIAFLGNNTTSINSKNNCAFVSIGDGLTDGEAAAFYTAVQAYQTTLNRQV